MTAGESNAPTGIRRVLNTNTLAAVLLLAAMAVSLVRVMGIQKSLFDPGKITIRVAHWQLELGYREALQRQIDEYNRLHRKDHVEVVQMAVTERVYRQWLNVHLISGTAPDLSELGMAKFTSEGRFVMQFFTPVTEYVTKPNPYNAGTALEHTPWRDTFYDGMLGGYRDDLQDYFNPPLFFSTTRLFYNKALLRAATGTDQPPRTLGALLDACDKIRALGARTGKQLVPIAGSKYSRDFFFSMLTVPFTEAYQSALDTDLDGEITSLETYAGFQRRAISFGDQRMRAYFECFRAMCDQFSKGFMAMDRDQAAFLFVQGDAVMISSGSWDANSLFRQAKFDVGVTHLPLPGPGERWHAYIAGPVNEATATGYGGLGLYKYSRHKEWAVDFLQFITSREHNEKLNRDAGWLPVTVGATPSAEMTPFTPDPTGFSPLTGLSFKDCGRISTFIQGQLWVFLQGEIDYPTLQSNCEQAIANPGIGADRVWAEQYDGAVATVRDQERYLAVHTTLMLMDPSATNVPPKFRRALLQQAAANNGEHLRYLYQRQNHRPMPPL